MLRKKIISLLVATRSILAKETAETKQMLITYKQFLEGKASKQEMEAANEQFRELVKGLGLGVFAVLPFAPLTIPFLVKFGKRLGVDILPKYFKDL